MASASDDRSPYDVAFKLLVATASAEGKGHNGQHGPAFNDAASEEWILNTYAKCLDAVLGYGKRLR